MDINGFHQTVYSFHPFRQFGKVWQGLYTWPIMVSEHELKLPPVIFALHPPQTIHSKLTWNPQTRGFCRPNLIWLLTYICLWIRFSAIVQANILHEKKSTKPKHIQYVSVALWCFGGLHFYPSMAESVKRRFPVKKVEFILIESNQWHTKLTLVAT